MSRARTSMLASKRSRLARLRGVSLAPVPAAPVRAHVQQLLDAGATGALVAALAGVGDSTVSALMAGRSATMHRPVAARLLATRLDVSAAPEGLLVPRLGSVRRVQALMAIGWRHTDLLQHGGGRTALVLSQAGDLITVRRAMQLRELYEQLHTRPGPSATTRNRALAAGFAPPQLWDDEDLDDPQAWPRPAVPLAEVPRAPGERVHRVDVENLEWLLDGGMSAELIAEKWDVGVDALLKACERAGRMDLRRRCTRTAGRAA